MPTLPKRLIAIDLCQTNCDVFHHCKVLRPTSSSAVVDAVKAASIVIVQHQSAANYTETMSPASDWIQIKLSDYSDSVIVI